MRTVLITIDGPHGPVDADLAGETPIRALAPLLFALTGVTLADDARDEQTFQPPSRDPYLLNAAGSRWTLELREGQPLPVDYSLIACQVFDGMRLTLRDVVAQRREREQAAQFVAQVVQPSAATAGVGVVWRRDDANPADPTR
ncbi:MAG TPA: EsaB/YukD family protein [Ktedonobacterales bacterium]|nr:EsaB/YukD family protein [Ktedonobacterales bacterium]